MGNIKLTIAYDGTNYHGFQEQCGTGFKTVQEVLENKLSRLAGRQVRITGAGRTDAGVHARGQVVNFDSGTWTIPPQRVACALNGMLPDDIAALESAAVPGSFHARFSATAKLYRYTIYNGKMPVPFHRLYSYHIPRPLDVAVMRAAARHLVGKHDFKAFRALGTPVKTTVRTLFDAAVSQKDGMVFIDLRADGFLYHMARMIAGTLIRVGLGRLPAAGISEILAGSDRFRAGPTAPARGLCLEKVEYPENYDIAQKCT